MKPQNVITYPSPITKIGDNRFVFVAPMYNASKYVGQMLHSIVGQSYDNWGLIIIDDVSSVEEQIECNKIIKTFQNLLIQTNRDPSKITAIWNSENGRGKCWEVSNVLYGISKCHDSDVVCRIDCDDWLTDLDALAQLNAIYNQSGAEAAWTAHRWEYTDRNISNSLPADANPYVHPWVSSHLKTFRKRLINGIPYENFTNMNGELVKRAGDQALYLPILHKAKVKGFIPRVMYHYTIDEKGGSVYQTDDAKFQKAEADFIRQRGYVSIGPSWEEKLL